MNQTIRNISWDRLIFFDLEMASSQKKLDPKSDLFKVFQYKKRNRETEELLPTKEVQTLFDKIAALDPVTGRIVSGTLGYVKDDKIHLKSYSGEEKDVVGGIVNTLGKSGRIVAGYNIIGYDLPYLRKRHQFLDLGIYPENLNDVGIKPWDLEKSILDLMNLWKGTGFYHNSLEELCWGYNIPSPKDTGVKGSEVSKAFWAGRIEDIVAYNEADVIATINVFRKMRSEPLLEEVVFIDKN